MNPLKYLSDFFETINYLPELFTFDPFGFEDEIDKTYQSMLYELPKQEEYVKKEGREKERY